MSDPIHRRHEVWAPLGAGATRPPERGLRRSIPLSAVATAKVTTRATLSPTQTRHKATTDDGVNPPSCADGGPGVFIEDHTSGGVQTVREGFAKVSLAGVPAGSTVTAASIIVDPSQAVNATVTLREGDSHSADLEDGNVCARGGGAATQALALDNTGNAQSFVLNAAMVAALQGRVGSTFVFYFGPPLVTLKELVVQLVVDYWPPGEP